MANSHQLKLHVKQGEVISKSFTIKQDGVPLDLTDYQIKFQVKKAPYEKQEPVVDKTITSTSDINTVGQITQPSDGKWQVRLLKEDTSLPVSEYYLIIYLVNGATEDIVSSNYCNDAKYIVCTQ